MPGIPLADGGPSKKVKDLSAGLESILFWKICSFSQNFKISRSISGQFSCDRVEYMEFLKTAKIRDFRAKEKAAYLKRPFDESIF